MTTGITMKISKLLGACALILASGAALAAGGTYPTETAPKRLNDMAALQNGAKLFVNYCMGCHSASSMRYNKLTEIGLTEDQIKRNLLFTSDKIGDLMTIAMTRQDGANWFGAAPPDLSVIARAKSVNLGASGVDYVYTFLRTFYRDTSKATGWNNLAFPSVGMPNVLWQLQGPRNLVHTTVAETKNADGTSAWTRKVAKFDAQGFSEVSSEALAGYTGSPVDRAVLESPNPRVTAQFDNQVADLANFLGWMAEPVQQQRKKIGVWVLLFLGLFLLITWRLNAVYWKHVR